MFYELIGFNAPDAATRSWTQARPADRRARADRARPRQPRGARAVFGRAAGVPRDSRDAIDRDPFAPCSVHLSESAEEVEFIRTGGGPWRALLEEVGAWNPAWVPPGVSPVQYLDDSGFLDARVLAVHGVQMTDADLARLAARGTTLVTCPRSNGHTGAGAPPIDGLLRVRRPRRGRHRQPRERAGSERLRRAGDDARAGAGACRRRRCSRARRGRAPRALGFDADYGTIEPGKRARLLAVGRAAGRASMWKNIWCRGIRAGADSLDRS